MPTAKKFGEDTTFVYCLAQQMRHNADQYTTRSFFSRVEREKQRTTPFSKTGAGEEARRKV
jgi:ADP-ribosylglycohydrolase